MKFKDIQEVARNSITRGLRDGFKRTTTYKDVMKKARVEKPRYKKDGTLAKRPEVFYRCAACKELCKQKDIQVDHVIPVQPTNKLLKDVRIVDYIKSIYNASVQVLCKPCHTLKSKAENKERREFKKRLK